MDHLRRAFRDIAAGHTRTVVLGREAYIKHLSHADQIDLDEKREWYYNEARQNGVETEAERIEQLKKWGEWTDQQARALEDARIFRDSLIEGKQKNAVKFPSMVKDYLKKIDVAEKDYREKLRARQELLGLTCEAYADREVNDHYVLTNLFADKRLDIPFFTEREYNYLSTEDGRDIIEAYNRAIDSCSDRNLKKLAMQAFFQRQFQVCGDSFKDFFGRPICDLTYYQIDLLRYGAHFRDIYANHDVRQFPKDVMEDPDALSEYVATINKTKSELGKTGAYEENAVVLGMKPEDAKVTGVKASDPMAEIRTKFGGNVMAWAQNRA